MVVGPAGVLTGIPTGVVSSSQGDECDVLYLIGDFVLLCNCLHQHLAYLTIALLVSFHAPECKVKLQFKFE